MRWRALVKWTAITVVVVVVVLLVLIALSGFYFGSLGR
jgi:hypothetical protein